MSSFLERLRTWRARRRRAKRFGIPFVRSRSWQVPERFMIRGRAIEMDDGGEPEHVWWLVGEIILNDCYFLEQIHDISTILDVGANKGFFLLAARAYFPDAIVHGYEPNPMLGRSFRTNYENLRGRPYFEAVGAEAGFCEIESPENGPSGLACARPSDSKGGITVTPLNAAVKRLGGIVDLMKMDIEGGEWDILHHPHLLGGIRTITMEYHKKSCPVDDHHEYVRKMLLLAGYNIIRQIETGETGHVLAMRN